jgi:hypothetical protein
VSQQDRDRLVEVLGAAFGDAVDVTPAEDQPAHILLPSLELPEPWTPSPTRALTVWQDWPTGRPQFVIDEKLTGEGGQPPRSHHSVYLLGQSWRGFSFTFPWSGADPVRVVQLWLTRFTVERA